MKMKRLFFALASVALAGVLALTSCSEPTPSTSEFQLSKTGVELFTGDTVGVIIEALNADATVEWTLNQTDEFVFGVENPDNNKQYGVIGVAVGEASLTAKCGDKIAECKIIVSEGEGGDEPEPIDPSTIPAVETPKGDQVTVVVKVPDGSTTCGGVGCTGQGIVELAKDWAPGQCLKFEEIQDWPNWYQATLTGKEGKVADIQMKVLGLAEDNTATDWANQWGKPEEVTLIQGKGDFGKGPEPQLTAMEGGSVVYINIAAWQTDPCQAKNAAGHAKFFLTAENLPAEATAIQITGNFAAGGDYTPWAPGAGLPMVKGDDGVWTAECEVPAAFQYKYLWSADGVAFDWDHSQKAGNLQMSLDLQAIDTIVEWIGGAPAPDPAPDVK